MPHKKPLPIPSTAARPNFPNSGKKRPAPPANALQKPDNRWQRSKRYGWDGR